MTPFVAEIIGTFMLLLLGDGVVANAVLPKTKGVAVGSNWMIIATGWGFAVYTGVLIAAPYSGAHLNPAVTLGLAAGGEFPWSDVLPYIGAQFIGAGLATLCVYWMYKDHINEAETPEDKRVPFYTYPEIHNTIPNLVSEILGTFVLLIAVFYIADPVIENEDEIPIGMGSLGALPVAIIVWVIGLSLGGTTGYAINPARDWGPRLVYNLILPIKEKVSSDWKYSWIPIVGPISGALLAAAIYLLAGS